MARRALRAGLGLGSIMLFAAASPSAAQHVVAGSTGTPGDPGQECAACHGMHEPNQGVAALRLGDGDLRITPSVAPGLGDASLSCLRCHSTARERQAVQPVDGAPALPMSIVEGRYLGPDFADDHPLGEIEADPRWRRDDGIRAFRSGRSRGGSRTLRTRFRTETVECTTCHDPHSRTGPIPNPEKEAILCGSCHDVTRYAFGMHASVACSDCHSLHAARGEALLPEHDETRMCESCHGRTGIVPSTTDPRRLRLLISPTAHVLSPGGRCGDCHPAHGAVAP